MPLPTMHQRCFLFLGSSASLGLLCFRLTIVLLPACTMRCPYQRFVASSAQSAGRSSEPSWELKNIMVKDWKEVGGQGLIVEVRRRADGRIRLDEADRRLEEHGRLLKDINPFKYQWPWSPRIRLRWLVGTMLRRRPHR